MTMSRDHATSAPPHVAPPPAQSRVGTLPEPWAEPLTVAGLLALPIMERGRPEVLAGSDLDERVVRWVHTSEIYEISPLLKGGEVLLTTGLGLVGCGPAALADYVTALARRSVAALVLELGRTFTTVPEALVTAADRTGLPLITLHGIVPFVDITESVHASLVSQEISQLRLGRHLDTVATAAVLSSAGLAALLGQLASVAECPVRLFADDGHLVAASDGAALQRSGQRRPVMSDCDEDFPYAPVELRAQPWGHLVVCGAPSPTREAVVVRGAAFVALELRSGGGSGPSRYRAGAQLIRDIFARQYSSTDEIAARATALGLVIRPGGRFVTLCLAVDAPPASPASPHEPDAPSTAAAVTTAVERSLGPSLVAELDGSILVACAASGDDLRHLVTVAADAIDSELTTGRVTAVACGPAVGDVGALARSLRIAHETSTLARRLHSDRRTLTYTDVGVQRLLSRFASDPELAAFVDEQLGPLLDYDATHGRDLVRTLDSLLAHGMSKAAAARDLRIRRQTLYQRLQTISTLLGGLDLSSRERRTSLDLALVGWRLRTSGLRSSRSAPAARR